jgi:phasin family protein
MSEPLIAVTRAASHELPGRAARTAALMNEFASLCVGTTEQIVELNRRAIRATIDEQQAVAAEAANEYSPFGVWRLQTSYALAGTAKAASYWRHVNEILLGAFADAVNQTESRLNDSFMAISGALEDTASGVGSALLTGDPSRAVEGVKDAVQIVDTEGNVVPSRRYK